MKNAPTIEDRFIAVLGSWKFLFLYLGTSLTWILVNTFGLPHPIDAYPCQFWNLVLAIQSGCAASIMLISQARADKKRDALLQHINKMEERIMKEIQGQAKRG